MKRLVLICSSMLILGMAQPVASKSEFRGVWLRPPNDPAQIPQMLDEIKQAGFNAVLVETFYHGFTISATSPIPTRPEFQGLDILQEFVRHAQQRDLEIHAWVEVFYWEVDTSKYPQFPRSPLLVEHPEWVLKLKGGRETWDLETAHRFANPAHPQVRGLLVDYFRDLLSRYELDGLNLDYIRYPAGAQDAGYDDFTLQRFKAEQGFDPSTISPNQTAQWKLWVEWRENQVTQLVREVKQMKQQVRPTALLSAAIFPDYYEGRYRTNFKFQDWGSWLHDGLIDAIMPMSYANTLAAIRRQIAAVQERAPASVQVLPGLAIETRKKDEYTGEQRPPIAEQIELTRSLQLPGHVIFCYDWIVNSAEGWKAFREGVYRRAEE